MSMRRPIWTVLVLCLGLLVAAVPGGAVADDGATRSEHGPLAVVLDLSGSMADDDGTGTVKLDGAKEALVSVVRTQANRGDTMRLWTYPGGMPAGGCAAGEWASEEGQDALALAANINALTANGDTPTGPALRQVADALKEKGNDKAVLLLVSDGMSNCGTPPCEVAQELVNEGFQLTVQAMGFQIDSGGRQELECIANVTGGSYFDAEDAEDLIAKIEEYGLPHLELDVEAPAHVASGDVVEVRVTVSNNSVQEIPGVTISLQPQAGDETTILPAIIPPVVPVGNLPGNASRTYAWEMPLGSLEKGGTVKLKVVAMSSGRVTPVSEDVIISALGPEFDLREPTWLSGLIADGSDARIAILGDSYSSGEGAGDYHPETRNLGDNECHRSDKTYLAAAGLTNHVIIACSGATSTQVRTSRHWDQPAQTSNPLLLDTSNPVEAVFMTIGGNDIGFAEVLTDCVVPWANCDTKWAGKPLEAQQKKKDLTDTYVEVFLAINSPDLVLARGGVAPVVVLPYPRLVPARATGTCSLTVKELAFGQNLINQLNSTIEKAVAETGIPGIIHAGPVASALGSNGLCSENPHFNNPTTKEGAARKISRPHEAAELGHLNADGYMDVTRALQNWAHTQDWSPSNVGAPEHAGSDEVIHESKAPVLVDMGDGEARATTQVIRGGAVRIVLEGYGAGAPIMIVLHSLPVTLATGWADDNGRVDITVDIPPDTEVGLHRLVVSGQDADGEVMEQSADVEVARVEPWWVFPGMIAAVVLGAVGLVLLLTALLMRWRRKKRLVVARVGGR